MQNWILYFRMDIEAAEELYSAYGGKTPTSKVFWLTMQ